MSTAVSHRPDPDELAAFIDGQLSGEERRKLEAHLGACEACREIVAESLLLLEDVSEEDLAVSVDRVEADEADAEPAGGKVLTHPSWRRTAWRLAPLAAAAALGFLLWPTLRSFFQPRPLSSAEMIAHYVDPKGLLKPPRPESPEQRLVEDWSDQGWPVFRSSNYVGTLSEEQIEFRLGVRAVDLQIALQIGSETDQFAILGELIVLLRDGVDFAAPLEQLYEQIRDSIDTSSTDPLLEATSQAEEALQDFFPSDHYALGKWAEVGRMATMIGDAAYFDRSWFGPQAKRLERAGLDPKTKSQIRQIREVSSGTLDQSALQTLRAAFDEIIRSTG